MATINDGGAPFGSAVLTIGGVAFVGESISVNEPSTSVEVRNQIGEPTKQITIGGFITGTATLQFEATTTVAPTIGAVFLYARNAVSAFTYYVSEVGEPVTNNDIKKVTIGFRKKYN